MGPFGLLRVLRRGRRLVFLLFAITVAAPVLHFAWPNAARDVINEIRSPSTTAP